MSGKAGADHAVLATCSSGTQDPLAPPSDENVHDKPQGLWARFVAQFSHFNKREVSGCFGDLGTFLPLTIGLVDSVSLDLGTTLVFTGLYNIYSGAAFGVPIPVQPMKSIAAVAITEADFTLTQTMLAGLMVSAVVFVLGITGLIRWAQHLVPDYVIRGIQLGLGLKLVQKGLRLVLFKNSELDYRDWLGVSGLLVGLLASLYVLVTVVKVDRRISGTACEADDAAHDAPSAVLEDVPGPAESVQAGPECESGELAERHASVQNARDHAQGQVKAWSAGAAWHAFATLPTALVLVIVGIVMTMVDDPNTLSSLSFGPATPTVIHISKSDWLPAFERGALPQLPLTLLNSVVAVVLLSRELFPEVPISPVHVASSVGIMNLVGPWIGVMPCCHGAGGLAAQARFGAQSGLAPMMLGMFKLALGLLFGGSLFSLLSEFPEPLLGVMLVVSGAELGSVASKVKGGKREWMAMLMTAGGCFAKDTATGFFVGVFVGVVTCSWRDQFQHLRQWCSERRHRLPLPCV